MSAREIELREAGREVDFGVERAGARCEFNEASFGERVEVAGVLETLDEPAGPDRQLAEEADEESSSAPAQLRVRDLLVRRYWSARLADSLQRQLRPVRQVLELVDLVERHCERWMHQPC